MGKKKIDSILFIAPTVSSLNKRRRNVYDDGEENDEDEYEVPTIHKMTANQRKELAHKMGHTVRKQEEYLWKTKKHSKGKNKR